MINCEFNNCVYWDGQQLKSCDEGLGDFWQFQNITCYGDTEELLSSTSTIYELIENDDRSFYLQKTISYGDFLLASFLILFFCSGAVIFIRDFIKNRKLERL